MRSGHSIIDNPLRLNLAPISSDNATSSHMAIDLVSFRNIVQTYSGPPDYVTSNQIQLESVALRNIVQSYSQSPEAITSGLISTDDIVLKRVVIQYTRWVPEPLTSSLMQFDSISLS